MKKLLLLLLLSLGCISVANADDAFTISDVFQIFPALWGLVKFWFALPGVLVVTVFYDTSLGHFFEVGRYSEAIITIINLVYWIGGFVFMLSISDYLYELAKSRRKEVFDIIGSWLYLVWFILPALLGFIIYIIRPELLTS